jgi:hypothetical protein
MTKANAEGKKIITFGDANLDSQTWQARNYRQSKIANNMQNEIVRNGMKMVQMGSTFLANKAREDGTHSESALDHIYI